ncbi:polysaccharide pyruvyl transferase family protein [Alkalihalobacillus sp. TS-13]|uniref:polysaccharide pyruvyl transferase family protein n=1 Tax=Alkalihalobacillus sp. TS-13 TaxID=2842455 RepID=UPI001C883701|nr:polysaccharide pyruvyl transferase family protein [Alkalihalobacillus sp. TS-13]
MKKNVVLLYSYGLKNGGDMAITLGAIDLLKNMDVNLKVYSLFDKSHPQYQQSNNFLKNIHPDIEIIESPFTLNREGNMSQKIKTYFNGIRIISGLKKVQLEIDIKKSDFVFFNGGNLFRASSVTDYLRLSALMYPLRLAQKHNVPYYILPQSAAKIDWIGKLLMGSPINSANKIWVRENISFDYLNKLFPKANIDKNIDLAFNIKENSGHIKDEYNFTKKKCVAITLRNQTIGDLEELEENKNKKILYVFKKVINNLIEKNHHILLVVQTKKDLKISERLLKEFKSDVQLIEEYNPFKLLNIYNKCELIIGMRLHSIILAISAGIPAIGFFDKSWGFKNPGIMEKFEMEYYFIENDHHEIIKTMDRILNIDNLDHKKKILKIITQEKENIVAQLSNE